MTQPIPLLTPSQVVEKLAAAGIQISEESVRDWTRTGKVPFVRLPSGRIYFRPADIDAFLAPIMPTAGAA